MHIGKLALGVLGAIALSSTSASAAVVCNEEGDCWRVKDRYEYPPEVRLRVYKDDWTWPEAEKHKYRWREDRGRGYWRKGVWIEF
jgi:hypothetical protein